MTARERVEWRDSCGGTPVSAFVLFTLGLVGPAWLQRQSATTKN